MPQVQIEPIVTDRTEKYFVDKNIMPYQRSITEDIEMKTSALKPGVKYHLIGLTTTQELLDCNLITQYDYILNVTLTDVYFLHKNKIHCVHLNKVYSVDFSICKPELIKIDLTQIFNFEDDKLLLKINGEIRKDTGECEVKGTVASGNNLFLHDNSIVGYKIKITRSPSCK
jgi:hypothetical protein